MRDVGRHHRGRVVAADFPAASALGCDAVEVAHDADIGIFETAFEVRAYRRYHDDKQVLVGLLHTDARRKTDFERTYVERCAAAIGRYETLVELDGLEAHFFENLNRHRFHKQPLGRLLEAFGILFEAEDADFAVFATEGLQAFEDFLAVVQRRGGHVYVDGVGLRYFDGPPLPVAKLAPYVVISRIIAKREIAPVY